MVKKVWQTDRRTDGQTDGKKCSQSCLVAAKKNPGAIYDYHNLGKEFILPGKYDCNNLPFPIVVVLHVRTVRCVLVIAYGNFRLGRLFVYIIGLEAKIRGFLSCVTLKTKGHLFYAISSFVHHFTAICEFKIELQSGNAQENRSKSAIFVPCELEIWRMTSKNKKGTSMLFQALCIISKASVNSKWS